MTELISILIGFAGLIIAAMTFYRTRKNETMVRIHLANLSGKAKTIKRNAQWANDHFEKIRKCMDQDDWEKIKGEASKSVQEGGRDTGVASRLSHELLRDVRSIQLSIFGKAEHLQSDGKLVLLSSNLDQELKNTTVLESKEESKINNA